VKRDDESYRIAAAQITPVFLNREQTVRKACATIAAAAEQNVRLLLFPEAFIPAYPDWIWLLNGRDSRELDELYVILVENAVTVPDETTARLCRAAKDAGVSVVIGINERNREASNGSLYNTLLYIDDRGEILGKHRKLVPTGAERGIWAQGDGHTLQAYQTPLGIVGGLICWENYMPLARQAMYAQGVQLYMAPTWDQGAMWLTTLKHIAREGGMYVIGCCMPLHLRDIPDDYGFRSRYPEGTEWVNRGHSCIIAPDGTLIAGPAENEEVVLWADIDITRIVAAKRMFDVTGHYARPDVFQFGVSASPALT